MEKYTSKFTEGSSGILDAKPKSSDKYEMMKDGFGPGEFSIYLRKRDERGDVSSEIYLFGISKRHEAQNVVDYLNNLIK